MAQISTVSNIVFPCSSFGIISSPGWNRSSYFSWFYQIQIFTHSKTLKYIHGDSNKLSRNNGTTSHILMFAKYAAYESARNVIRLQTSSSLLYSLHMLINTIFQIIIGSPRFMLLCVTLSFPIQRCLSFTGQVNSYLS